MSKGRFITFEGGEGTGKSTQVALLATALADAGVDVISTREPGGAPGAEEIRNLLVNGATNRWTPMSEALLNYAARAEHLDKTVYPALEKGQWVISDRFADSTMAYQGFGHGVKRGAINKLGSAVLGDFKPDLTIIFDLDLEVGLERAGARGQGEDRYERMGHDFHDRLRQGFLQIANDEPERCVVIDASAPIEQIAAAIRAIVSERLSVPLS
ncbi:MAG: dTMP kinase [Rhodospirillaceae bacterium]|nr:dTMP kinase [Rhodospirillaceae bacterium]MBT5245043.1 dTMP kinase [Rhodospirillaceae bacterium]MBT5561071.1 dTMP kinase [Rhodospirillaceae bacterium]MBT6242771.1 dTMP kinase [Rhodospirillaceae bacterium]